MALNMERGYPQRVERLPERIEQIDAAWLTRTMRYIHPSICADSLSVVQHVRGHTTKLRLAVSWSGEGADQLPSALCLKANLTGDPISGPANVNEARFYRDMADRLPLPAPPCYFADWDDDAEGHQGVMILEDLVPWGGTFGTSAEPISAEEARRGIEGLAALHGSTWGDRQLDESDWLFTAMAPETVVDDYWTLMGDYVDKMNALPGRLAAMPEWIAKDPMNLRRAWLQLRAHELAHSGPRCLVHGDAHLGNSYALPDGRRLFLDWQIVRKGRPWRDYTYWAVGSIPIAERRTHERDLLQHYLTEMARHGVTIPFEEAWDEYRRWLVWGLVSWHLNANPNEDTPATLSRFTAAAKDHRVERFYQL